MKPSDEQQLDAWVEEAIELAKKTFGEERWHYRLSRGMKEGASAQALYGILVKHYGEGAPEVEVMLSRGCELLFGPLFGPVIMGE